VAALADKVGYLVDETGRQAGALLMQVVRKSHPLKQVVLARYPSYLLNT